MKTHRERAIEALCENYGRAGLRALRRRSPPTDADLASVGGFDREEARDALVEARPMVRRIIVRAARCDRRQRRLTTPCMTVRVRPLASARRRRETTRRTPSRGGSRGDPDLSDSEPEPPLATPRSGGPPDNLAEQGRAEVTVGHGSIVVKALERRAIRVEVPRKVKP